MLKIKRLGRRSFEVFRNGAPVGLVMFLKDLHMWSFKPYPVLGREHEAVERRDGVLRNLLCPEGEYCAVDRSASASP